MVGVFLSSPFLQLSAPSSLLTRSRPFSIAAALMLLLLLLPQAAIARPASAAAATETGFILRSTNRPRFNAAKKSHLADMQGMPTTTSRQRHRHLLVSAGAAQGSQITADQAMRALVGSSPPKCVKKCGACTPCKSVLVPIHTTNLPATPTEYYPEAWRCQCRGKTYNP